jgi:hypothetical protein
MLSIGLRSEVGCVQKLNDVQEGVQDFEQILPRTKVAIGFHAFVFQLGFYRVFSFESNDRSPPNLSFEL